MGYSGIQYIDLCVCVCMVMRLVSNLVGSGAANRVRPEKTPSPPFYSGSSSSVVLLCSAVYVQMFLCVCVYVRESCVCVYNFIFIMTWYSKRERERFLGGGDLGAGLFLIACISLCINFLIYSIQCVHIIYRIYTRVYF